jgi:nucleotidyltransferase AbiEii toxin of type IV toxin-antitoxin system
MLQYKTIDPKALELLKKLQNLSAFSDLRLVGGTSLALQIGHRKSIDLDLFGNLDADEFTVSKKLNDLGSVSVLKKSENINIYSIDGIKVDIVNYPYPWLQKVIVEDNLRLADARDIAAMKLSAITNRGTKKDFIDLFFLLKEFTLSRILGFYSRKYHDGSEFLVLKSLSYFDDAEKEESPNMLIDIDWNEIKKYICIVLDNYLKAKG